MLLILKLIKVLMVLILACVNLQFVYSLRATLPPKKLGVESGVFLLSNILNFPFFLMSKTR